LSYIVERYIVAPMRQAYLQQATRMWIKRILVGTLAFITISAIAGAAYQFIATRQQSAANPAPGQLIDIGGYHLHAWCTGEGSPAVILDTGLGGSLLDWGSVQREVAKFSRVCSYDRAGMGFSDLGPSPRTSRRIAAELHELLDRIGIRQPVVLVGASFGGFNIRMFASEYPDRSAGLVLVDAAHEDQGARYAAAGAPEEGIWYARAVPLAAFFGVMRLAGNSIGNAEELPPTLRRYAHVGSRTNAWRTVVDEYLHIAQSSAEVRATRHQLNIPLVVLTAGHSDDLPKAQAAWMEMQRDQVSLSSLGCQVVAEGAHHVMMLDAPDVVVQAIRLVVDASRSGGIKPAC
jgi:pimeloyl-ACP methyl ester carboxylesterase